LHRLINQQGKEHGSGRKNSPRRQTDLRAKDTTLVAVKDG